jgi:hypothetical protein
LRPSNKIALLRSDVSVIATPWTAPASLKTNKSLIGGSLKRRQENSYADLLRSQTEWLVDAGVPLTAISLGNEPGHSSNYPSMTMTDSQMVKIAERISTALEAVDVDVLAVDHNWNDRDRVDNVLADAAPGTFAGAAFHCYEGSPEAMAGLNVPAIVTECTGTTDTWESTFGWDSRELVVKSALAGSTGLMMWNLALDPDHGPKAPGGCEDCRGLVTIDPTLGTIEPTPEFYTLAHVARAADPGAVRLGSTVVDEFPTVSFENPDGTVGVFGHNDTGSDQLLRITLGSTESHTFEIAAGEMFSVRGLPEQPEPQLASAGDVVQGVAGESYLMSISPVGLVRQLIPSETVSVCVLATGPAVIDLTQAQLDQIPAWSALADDNCIVRAPEGDSHYVNDDGQREWVPDSDTWFCEIDNGVAVVDSTRGFIDAISEAGWHSCVN